MKRLLALAIVLAAARADASLFELHAALRAGGTTGKGLGGAQKENDFFAHSRGGVYGAVVGLELMWIDFFIEHDQFTDLSGIEGTWTQLMIGPHFAFPLEEGRGGGKTYADLAVAAGVGFGTGQQIDPPLDNAEISDKGVMLELRIGVEHRFNRFFGVGLSFPLAWGYMFKDGVVTDTSNHYQTFHAMGLVTVNFRLGL